MIVRLNGGLGNQMFQYAFGRSVSQLRDEDVKFHKFNLDVGPRAYGLGAFNTNVEFADKSDFGPEYHEPSFAFCPDVYTTRANYFVGNWQTEKYFNEQLVRHHFFVPIENLTSKTWNLMNHITRFSSSCFIHVRRTDYLVPSVAAYHGVMGMDYYGAAIDYVTKRIPDTRFFVFSDDPNWCKEHFVGDRVTIIDDNKAGNGVDGPGQEHEDLYLMSQCDHAIIPNSSFGWWGAYLGKPNADRIVIAPNNWFVPNGTAKHLDTKDICPEPWVRL